MLFFFQIWRPQRRTGYRLWKGEILDVIKQITGSWYSWIGSYHIAFGDSEVQSSNSSGNSCYFNLVQIRLRLKLYEKKKAFILPCSAVYGLGLGCRKLISAAVYRYSPQLMAIGESRNVDWVGKLTTTHRYSIHTAAKTHPVISYSLVPSLLNQSWRGHSNNLLRDLVPNGGKTLK